MMKLLFKLLSVFVLCISACSVQSNQQESETKPMKVTIEIENQELQERLIAESESMGLSKEERILKLLDLGFAPLDNFEKGKQAKGVARIKDILEKIPAVTSVYTSEEESAYWWLKFRIDIDSKIAWNVVQELGFVLNYIAIEQPLPTVLKPVSPPPYLNGHAKEYLSWVIEPTIPNLDPNVIADFLEERLPQPLEKEESWLDE